MRFSLYSELQLHPGKTAEQLYAEVLEQMVNADRLGYDAYAVIEHYFYPKFSVSTNPTALFAAAAQRTRTINFRTMLPYHNPMVLAGVIAATDILTGGRYEWGVGRRGTAGSRFRPASRSTSTPAPATRTSRICSSRRSRRSASRTRARTSPSRTPTWCRKTRNYLGGTSDHTYTLAAEHG